MGLVKVAIMLPYTSTWPYKQTKIPLPSTIKIRLALRGIPLLVSIVLDEGQKINYLDLDSHNK